MKRQKRKATGLTLTELLVVVTIVVLVAGAMVPVIQPVVKGKTTREAAKIVREVFISAQAQAMAKQRPVGVWITRAAKQFEPNQERLAYTSYQLAIAEQPPTYTGDVDSAQVRLANQELVNMAPPQFSSNQNAYLVLVNYAVAYLEEVAGAISIDANNQPVSSPNSYKAVIAPGDKIRFAHRNEWLTLADYPRVHNIPGDCDGDGKLEFDRNLDGKPDPVVVFTYYDFPDTFNRRVEDKFMTVCGASGQALSNPMAFEITRQPRKTVAPPVDLPNNTAIDLSVSGMEDDGLARFRYLQNVLGEPPVGQPHEYYRGEICPEHDIVIMFNATGEVDAVHYMDSSPGFQSNYCQLFRAEHKVQLLPRKREVLGPIQLMIGRDDLIGFDLNDQPNYLDANGNPNPLLGIASLNEKTNIWLTIKRSLISTSPNAGFNTTPAAATPVAFYEIVRDARQLTNSGLSMGGR